MSFVYIVKICVIYFAAAGPCVPSPCKNKGTCHVVDVRRVRCECPPGLTGKTCEDGKMTITS